MRRSKGARLYLEGGRKDKGQRAFWIIRDGTRRIRTGCPAGERGKAEQKLAEYLAEKYEAPRDGKRHPAQILVPDCLNIYLTDVAPKHAFPDETKSRLLKLGEFFESDTLADINGKKCRDYVTWLTKQTREACKPDQTGKPALMVTEATARCELRRSARGDQPSPARGPVL